MYMYYRVNPNWLNNIELSAYIIIVQRRQWYGRRNVREICSRGMFMTEIACIRQVGQISS